MARRCCPGPSPPRLSTFFLGALFLILALGVVPWANAATPESAPAPSDDGSPARLAQRQAQKAEKDAGQEAEQEAERLRAERRAAAYRLSFDAPFYSIEGDLDTTLFLMNTVTDPIAVDVEVRNDRGDALPLGTYVIESLSHVELSLRERLAGFEEELSTGTVRCTLLGDADTLQGWAVVRSPAGETFEIPLTTAEDSASSRLVGFWDLSPPAFGPEPRVDLYLANISEQPVRGRVDLGPEAPGDRLAVEIPPGHQVRLKQGRGAGGLGLRGSVAVEHDGPPGALLGVLVAGHPSPAGTFELVDAATIAGTARYESLPLSRTGAADAFGTSAAQDLPWVTLFNGADSPQTVLIEILDATTGTVVDRTSVQVDAGAVRTVTPVRTDRGAGQPIRLRIQGERPPLLVRGGTPLGDGTTADIAFFAFEDSHGQGTYPLPDPERYETVTTLVNLGDEDAMVGVQVLWTGGTYAHGPLTVPARGLHRIDLEKLAESAGPDVLGRRLDRRRPDGVLKWTVMKGSTALIGRTDVRPRAGEDRFGFNCWGCCWENATASVLPGQVEFGPGDSRSFQSCITYNDCSGTMGPYPITPDSITVPYPFSWNSSTITSDIAADDGMQFGVEFLETSATCTSFLKWLFGFGRAEMCDFTFNSNDYNQRLKCTTQTSSCVECRACCQNLYQVKVCRGVDPNTRDRELMLCDTNCILEVCPG